MEQKRAPGTCCPDPECDYVSYPLTCPSCQADCLKCALRSYRLKKLGIKDKSRDFSKMTEGEALYSVGARAVEKDGKKGLNMPIPGKPGQSIFIEASDEKPGCIVASYRKQDRVKSARKTRCHDCRRKVWISPSTQEMLRRYPGTPVICLACFAKQAEAEAKKEKEA